MIKVFGPLSILAIISLFIFNQENGIGTNSFTTLSYRLINIATLLISYVSLINISRDSLPPTPVVTFVEALTYILTIPTFLALVNSMMWYTHTLAEWKRDYTIWSDSVFVVSLVLSAICLMLLLTVLVVYWLK